MSRDADRLYRKRELVRVHVAAHLMGIHVRTVQRKLERGDLTRYGTPSEALVAVSDLIELGYLQPVKGDHDAR